MAIRATAAQVRDWLKIQWQDGPAREEGDVNGVQIEDVIEAAEEKIKGLQRGVPCQENIFALDHLTTARQWLEERTKKREAQGVEGTDRPHRSGGGLG